jgi:hypothetical protein
MRKLTQNICVLASVISASYFFNAPAVASETLSARFGDTTLKLPYPNKPKFVSTTLIIQKIIKDVS